MGKRFKVLKHDANGYSVKVTQCGSAVKTARKAADLKDRMRAVLALRPAGESTWYTIERA
jgi:hypothetical protein